MGITYESAAELSCLSSRFKDFYISNASTMLGAYELGGIDPSGLGVREKEIATELLRYLIRTSPPELILTQYYVHRNNPNVTIKPREDKRSSVISKRRELFLQEKRSLCSSHIFFLAELPFASDLTKWFSFDFLQNIVSSVVSKDARNYIKTRISERNSVLAYEAEIKETAKILQEEIQNHIARLDLTSFGNKQLDGSQFWSLIKALHTLDFDFLNIKSNPPKCDLNGRVFDSTITAVNRGGVDYLKISGIKPMYLRIASIKGFSDEYIERGFFANGINSPIGNKGNYVLMTRYRGMNKRLQKKYFDEAENEVARNQINLMDMMKGDKKSQLEIQLSMSEKDKAVLKEVSDAQALGDYNGKFECSAVIFSECIEEIEIACKSLRSSLNQAGADIVWETAGLESAFECFLPGSQFESKRQLVPINSRKAAALSLFYKASTGIPEWEYTTRDGVLKKEEAFYIFESNDGSPFYYCPYIGGKCMVIGVGPIRSGKTFTKNSIATHFMKFNGYYSAIDIDPGTEAVARFFQDDGSIFQMTDKNRAGFNPFFIAEGADDIRFRAHFMRQLEAMVQSNSNAELNHFTKSEVQQLDEAMLSVLRLPAAMRSFSSFLDHCNKDIKRKLSKFHSDGIYANIYDNTNDAIGSLQKRFSVYNIMGVKDDKVSLSLVMSEIVYRVLRTFENPELRDFFKMLDIDEAHAFLAIPGMIDFLVKGIRTWGKWQAGVSLWTQSPVELKKIREWPALRSAASTFWFMADGEMDRDIYRDVFHLSEGHLDAIQSLIPKQQAFIYQPEIRVAKIINLYSEPEQRVINTSVAGEAMTLQRNLEHTNGDIDLAVQKTIADLNF
ncbi:hypothetical protein [Paraglaciecola sp. 20A4]|uniref:VirB4 family type IV secretion system protein n=1 Tax=Paraglaciecola sp. 20A4 TaxID=2687288 RepID=UPI00140D2B76|nr:hypothetical protein [Paraglaciecola sp. 20A4]